MKKLLEQEKKLSEKNIELTDISVIILTLNEELNLPQLLNSIDGWAKQVYVLDSFSIDKTVEIAKNAGCEVLQNKFVDYGAQFNYAFDNFQIKTEWVLVMDADEWVTNSLKLEISELIKSNPKENGFFIKWRMIWLNSWIKRGYYPTWVLRLCRSGTMHCEERSVNEHLIVKGKIGYLKNDFIHEDQKPISEWIEKQNRYAYFEALELYKRDKKVKQQEIKASFFGSQAERKRWMRYYFWNKMPLFIRPIFYFIYRYILSGAFIEGRVSLVYNFFHALWYPLLIDVKYLEMKMKDDTHKRDINVSLKGIQHSNFSIDSLYLPDAADVSIIVLTLNEELNLPHLLMSVKDWAHEVFVVDSFSNDKTVEIAKNAGCTVYQNKFVDYAKQRNFALKNMPIKTEWIMFMDADEWITNDLKEEISRIIASKPEENGYYVKWHMIWMKRWIKRGYYPTWVLRLFRNGKVRCEERSVNEHVIVDGKLGYLENYYMHEDNKSVGEWISKHNCYAYLEAVELFKRDKKQVQEEIKVNLWGSQAERKRWLRYHIWDKMPTMLRPFVYFFYRYILTGAFVEGRIAFVYHLFHALWFPLLIDAKYKELKAEHHNKSSKGEI